MVNLPEDGQYGIQTSTIRSATRIYLNGMLTASMGNPSETIDDFIPDSKYNLAFTNSIDKEVEILIHVSNYKYSDGGILKPISFGTFNNIMNRYNRERALEFFLIGMCLVVSLIFSLVFIRSKDESYIVYFSIAIFFMGLYISTINHQAMKILIDYKFFTRFRIQSFLMIAITLCFLEFINSFFKKIKSLKGINYIRIILILQFFTLIGNSKRGFILGVNGTQISIVLASTTAFIYMLIALMKYRDEKYLGTRNIVIIATSIIMYWLATFAKILFEFEVSIAQIFLIVTAVIGIILLISDRNHLEYKEATELTEERMEKEFKYFYSQISPHFLYNTLITIRALTFKNLDSTREALQSLSTYIRGKLELHINKGLSNLDRELDIARAYLDIEKLRYRDKLNISYDIDETLNAKIPPLTLQPLVENAIRHGLVPKDSPGNISISVIERDLDSLEILIEDDGVGIEDDIGKNFNEEEGFGLGLKNIIEKLNLLEGSSFELESTPGQGTKISIILKQEKDKDLEI